MREQLRPAWFVLRFFFFNKMLIFIYLKGTATEIQREGSSICWITPQMCATSRAGARLKPSAWNSTQVSYVGNRGPCTLSIVFCLQGFISRKWMGSGVAGTWTRHSDVGCRLPNQQLNLWCQVIDSLRLFSVWEEKGVGTWARGEKLLSLRHCPIQEEKWKKLFL